MTARQFGAWSVAIIGPQARITGPRAVSVIAAPATLRNMSHGAQGDKAAAYAWAIERLEAAV
jgi:hypothetical protein